MGRDPLGGNGGWGNGKSQKAENISGGSGRPAQGAIGLRKAYIPKCGSTSQCWENRLNLTRREGIALGVNTKPSQNL